MRSSRDDEQGRQLVGIASPVHHSPTSCGSPKNVSCEHRTQHSRRVPNSTSVAQENPLKSSIASAISTGTARADRNGEMPLCLGKPAVALLTGGGDKPYALGLGSTLLSLGVAFEFIGSDEVNGSELRESPLVNVLNLRGEQRPDARLPRKVLRVLAYYARLLRYAATAEPKIFHILWNNKLEFFDRTLLMLLYRLLGKRVVFTAHNVNAAMRDGNDSFLNRWTLKVQYHLTDHIFVHTEQMKRALRAEFGVPERRLSVIPFGINSTVPCTALTSAEAKHRLGLTAREKAVLFFGNIAPYKGLEHLVEAITLLAHEEPAYRLIIAGRTKNCMTYWDKVRQQIFHSGLPSNFIERIEFIPDEETEIYFKAADVLALPYTHVFQSGVLFLGYNFGLPVIASDAGSLREEIVEGRTGFVCRAQDSVDLAKAIAAYFSSDLFKDLDQRRHEIHAYAHARHSWKNVAEITTRVYSCLLRT